MSEDEKVILSVLYAWQDFKASHDLKDAKILCCDRSQRLFNSLDAYEKLIVDELPRGKCGT